MFQICQCGAFPSYPHASDCPFPYFGYSPAIVARWLAARAAQSTDEESEPTESTIKGAE
jgi:hypothetical protein